MLPGKRFMAAACALFVFIGFAGGSEIRSQGRLGDAPSYRSQIGEWEKSGASDTRQQEFDIAASRYASKTENGRIYVGDVAGRNNVLVWDDPGGEVSYRFSVSEPGFYNVYLEYYDMGADSETMERGLRINGNVPYAEADSFILGQHVRYDKYPFASDADGNNIRPKQAEIKDWYLEPIRDKTGMNGSPLRFYMQKGENEITFTGVSGTLALSRLILKSPEPLRGYTEYAASLPSTKSPGHFLQIVEGENPYELSDKGIQLNGMSEAGVLPEAYGQRIFNTIGGLSWENPGQWVEWQIEVPEDGLYQLGVKYEQGDNNALNAYREVEIDGKIPFRELQAVSFPFSGEWSNLVLGDGTPYSFYLTKGKHTVKFIVTSEPYADIYSALRQIGDSIRELDLNVKEVTGVTNDGQIDMYKQYDLKKFIPDLDVKLSSLSRDVEAQLQGLVRLTGSPPGGFDALRTAADNLMSLSRNLNDIPKSTDSLSRIQTAVLNFAESLAIQPLYVDRIMVKSVGGDFPKAKPSFWHSAVYFFKSFKASFSNRYDTRKGSEGTLEVWVQRNRDYVNLMQQYADEYFTPQSGIKVNVNYIPGPDLLVLANASGKQPDIATGVGMDTPFNFALRNAIVNLNGYPGYDKLKEQMAPGTLVPYHYNGQDYGLPEEATMNLMYYREDILNKYKLKVPQTWDDVKKIIPTLQQNNMNFWEPPGDWLTFFYQNGVDVYSPNGLDVGFDTPEGFSTFKYLTDLYVKYGLPESISSFYQHFRQGDVPIGVSGISDYLMFRVAAPEISSLWKIAPIPGTADRSGRIVRWQGGDEKGVMMFKTTKERQDRAWEFLQWWLSTDTQTRFANDLENDYGIEFRWFSANPEVVKHMPWAPEDKKTVLEQLQWFKGIPYVPGGSYMTGRELYNGWQAAVINKVNYREELERRIDDIRREMVRRQQEFGLVDGSGNVKKELDSVQVLLPTMEGSQ